MKAACPEFESVTKQSTTFYKRFLKPATLVELGDLHHREAVAYEMEWVPMCHRWKIEKLVSLHEKAASQLPQEEVFKVSS